MRLKPNDLPEMEKGEARNIVFKLAGATGVNAITGTPTVTDDCDGLTFGTPAVNGTNVTVLATAAKVGTHDIVITANLASNEIIKGYVRAHVVDSTCNAESDYQ